MNAEKKANNFNSKLYAGGGDSNVITGVATSLPSGFLFNGGVKMELKRKYLEIYNPNKRGLNGDNRIKGAYAVFSYYNDNGIEYRKSFWADSYTEENRFFSIAPETMTLLS